MHSTNTLKKKRTENSVRFFLLNYKLRSKRRFNVEPIRIDVCVRGQFWAMPKTEVESVSKSKAYFETLSYKLEVHELTRTSILKPLPCRQGWRCTKLLPSFSNEKLEVHELTRKSIRAPNTGVVHYLAFECGKKPRALTAPHAEHCGLHHCIAYFGVSPWQVRLWKYSAKMPSV